MQSEQYPQILPQKSSIKRVLGNNLANPSPVDEEGGLKFGSILQSLKRRLPVIIGVTTIVTALAVYKAATSKPTYQAGFEILAKPITEETRVISAVTANRTEEVKEKGKVEPTTLKLLKSPRILTPIVNQLKVKYPDVSYDSLAGTLVVTALPDAQILSVGYEDKDSAKVKAILDLVSKAYLDYSLEERLADVQQGIDFVEAQLPEVQKRAGKLQDQLQSFRQEYNLIDPESSSRQLAAQTSTISQQRLENQVKLDEARALFLDLNQQLDKSNSDINASAPLQANARYQALLAQVQTIESQIAKELSIFQENTDRIQSLRDQRANLIPLLVQEEERTKELISSQIRELEARRDILAQAEENLNQQVKQLSVISRQYTDIQQEIKITNDNLNQFLAKREALRIDAGQRKTPWQILTPVNNPVPSSADVKRNGLLGGVLGLLTGVGVALLLDKLSNLLRTPEEAEEVSKLPLLGVIPFSSSLTFDDNSNPYSIMETVPFNATLLAEEEPNTAGKFSPIINLKSLIERSQKKIEKEMSSPKSYYTTGSLFLESFRSLYTNIRLLSPDDEIRSIVISSSMPSEGKSTVSVNLAQAAAALGKRVLLVDGDLRRPKIHTQLQISNALGMSNLITSDLSVDKVIQRSQIEPTLSILTAGQVPPDPTRLLSSQKMQSLMQLFQETYDLVIYDTPPLIGIVDAKIIASETDGMIMVVGLDKTKSSTLTQALELLSNSPIVIFGIIANGSKDYAASLSNTYKLY